MNLITVILLSVLKKTEHHYRNLIIPTSTFDEFNDIKRAAIH